MEEKKIEGTGIGLLYCRSYSTATHSTTLMQASTACPASTVPYSNE
jgi:hypothetical protein